MRTQTANQVEPSTTVENEATSLELGRSIQYKGYTIETQLSRKNKILLYSYIRREDGRKFCFESLRQTKERIDSDLREEENRGLSNAVDGLINRFSGEAALKKLLEKMGLNNEQVFKSHDGRTYSVKRFAFLVESEVLDLASVSGRPRSGESFYDALNKAAEEFRKSPSKRSKDLSAEVALCLDTLNDNWEHSCEQEREDIGNRRYYWHGDKGRFLENFLNNPCSGSDNLETEFNSEFGENS